MATIALLPGGALEGPRQSEGCLPRHHATADTGGGRIMAMFPDGFLVI